MKFHDIPFFKKSQSSNVSIIKSIKSPSKIRGNRHVSPKNLSISQASDLPTWIWTKISWAESSPGLHPLCRTGWRWGFSISGKNCREFMRISWGFMEISRDFMGMSWNFIGIYGHLMGIYGDWIDMGTSVCWLPLWQTRCTPKKMKKKQHHWIEICFWLIRYISTSLMGPYHQYGTHYWWIITEDPTPKNCFFLGGLQYQEDVINPQLTIREWHGWEDQPTAGLPDLL